MAFIINFSVAALLDEHDQLFIFPHALPDSQEFQYFSQVLATNNWVAPDPGWVVVVLPGGPIHQIHLLPAALVNLVGAFAPVVPPVALPPPPPPQPVLPAPALPAVVAPPVVPAANPLPPNWTDDVQSAPPPPCPLTITIMGFNTSDQLQRRRNVAFRAGVVGSFPNPLDPRETKAGLIQASYTRACVGFLVGDEMVGAAACARCQAGDGKFSACVVDSSTRGSRGACVGCVWMGKPRTCSLYV